MTQQPQGRSLIAIAIALVVAACNEATLSLSPLQASEPAGGSNSTPMMPPQMMQPAPAPGVVSNWPLDADASDAVGGNPGIAQGGATFPSDLVRGPVLRCDGASAIVTLKNSTPLDFSYSVWFWAEQASLTGTSAREGSPLIWSNIDGAEDDFMLSLLNDKLAYLSYSIKIAGATSLIDKLWHHVVVTRQNGAKVALYVDGQLDGSGVAGTGPVRANPSVFLCGNPSDARYLAGRLDDVLLYDRALTAAEVAKLYAETRR